MSKNENEVIRIKALNIMSAGENTPKALYEKLKEKLPYADRDAIKIEIRRLILEGIVDEKRYGERFIELCKGKMYGHRRIENELAAKKFSEKFMNASAELILSDEEERALETNLTGRRAVYQLGIPKNDRHEWTSGTKVRFFGQTWRIIGEPVMGIESMIPLDWNKKVRVERCV